MAGSAEQSNSRGYSYAPKLQVEIFQNESGVICLARIGTL